MKNIVFIGLPGCGKTTISKGVASILNRPWFDSDLEIEAQEEMSIADIFALKGEEYFRQLETQCIRRLSENQGAVIAVGGGAILRNAESIQKNATVIYINRSVQNILPMLEPGKRPLLREPCRLYELHKQRHGFYKRVCDFMIMNNASLEKAYGNVLNVIA